ncbi:hypothetical protein D3C85_494590 [compost metagenome]
MAFEVNTYSPKDVSLAFSGYVLTGWNTITVSRNTNAYTTVRGIRGKNTRVRNVDTSATISFSCLQTSDSNDIMSSIHAIDIATGSARIELTLKDASGTSLFSSKEAYIQGYPESTFSGDFSYRVWTINCLTTESTWNVGGNSKPDTAIFDSAVRFVGDTLSNI